MVHVAGRQRDEEGGAWNSCQSRRRLGLQRREFRWPLRVVDAAERTEPCREYREDPAAAPIGVAVRPQRKYAGPIVLVKAGIVLETHRWSSASRVTGSNWERRAEEAIDFHEMSWSGDTSSRAHICDLMMMNRKVCATVADRQLLPLVEA